MPPLPRSTATPMRYLALCTTRALEREAVGSSVPWSWPAFIGRFLSSLVLASFYRSVPQFLGLGQLLSVGSSVPWSWPAFIGRLLSSLVLASFYGSAPQCLGLVLLFVVASSGYWSVLSG